jgi:hypothetical protein
LPTERRDDGGWTVEGFWRTDNRLPARPLVRVIEEGSDTVVRDMPLAADGMGSIVIDDLGGATRRALLAVSELAELSSEPLPYEIRLTSVP